MFRKKTALIKFCFFILIKISACFAKFWQNYIDISKESEEREKKENIQQYYSIEKMHAYRKESA